LDPTIMQQRRKLMMLSMERDRLIQTDP